MYYFQQYTNELQETLTCLPFRLIERLEHILFDARINNQQVFILGNGGSASTASHFVCDLAKNTRNPYLPHFRVIGLTDNMAILSAYANDEGYDSVFADQLVNFACEKDIVIAISTSGNSPNVIKAVELANQIGAITVGFTGFDGGKLSSIVDINIHVPNHCVEQVEDVHLILEHMLVKRLKDRLDNQKVIHSNLNSEEAVLDEEGQVMRFLENGFINAFVHEMKTENVQDGLEKLVNFLAKELDADGGNVIVFDLKGNPRNSILAGNGSRRYPADDKYQIQDVGRKGLAGWVKENSTAALVPVTSHDRRWLHRSWEKSDGQSRSAISAPIIADEKVVGVITLVRSIEKGPFTIKELSVLIEAFAKIPAMQMRLIYSKSND